VRTRLLAAFCLLSSLFAAPEARADGPAALVIAENGGVSTSEANAMRGLAAAQLEKRGIHLTADPHLDGLQPTGQELQQLVQTIGVARVFALRITGRIGQRIPLRLDELTPDLKPVFGSGLTTTLDEADVVVPRLVNAVVDRKNADDNASMRSVSDREAAAFKKKPGERFKMLGLAFPLFGEPGHNVNTPLGVVAGYQYEIEYLRLGADLQVMYHQSVLAVSAMVDGVWLPFETEFSPYIGLGVGYAYLDQTAGLAGKVEAGIEAMRLHSFRVVLGFELLIPAFDSSDGQPGANRRYVFPAGVLKIGF
jgi:hypothetical protein